MNHFDVTSAGTETELVTVNPPSVKQGPKLLEEFIFHCSVLVENQVYVIGGFGPAQTKVLMIDTTTSAMTYKSQIRNGRYAHSCARITGPDGVNQILVAGGFNGYNYLKSTEIYSIDEDSSIPGRNLTIA